ncbi:hypothetical protein MJ575_11605 [Klebsiella pneumoniae]|nr:hypothetical protein MJ575_11605 [Klebsiella pneumoniae]
MKSEESVTLSSPAAKDTNSMSVPLYSYGITAVEICWYSLQGAAAYFILDAFPTILRVIAYTV